MAVADLNLSGRAHWTEGVQHGLLFLEGLLLHTPYLAALLATGTGLAACAPLPWQPIGWAGESIAYLGLCCWLGSYTAE